MLAFISETKTAWEKLRETEKKIVLYGMGDGAGRILDWCDDNNVVVQGIFASDGFVRGQSFRGFKVESFADIQKRLGKDILVVIAFASEREDVLRFFKKLAAEYEVIAPHLPLFEEELPDNAWLTKYAKELQYVYDRLGDGMSKRVFADSLNYKLSGKIEYLFDCETRRANDLRELFTFSEEEIYADLGAYDGDTVKEFLGLTGGSFRKIFAVEPDRRNYRKLAKALAFLPAGKIVLSEQGIWSDAGEMGFSDSGGRQSTCRRAEKVSVSVDSLDNIVGQDGVSYIKIDVEGAEAQALQGARKVIAASSPKIFVAAYHYDTDLFKLPLLLWEIAPDYRVYLRKHPYIPCWELNYLCKR